MYRSPTGARGWGPREARLIFDARAEVNWRSALEREDSSRECPCGWTWSNETRTVVSDDGRAGLIYILFTWCGVDLFVDFLLEAGK